MSWNHFLLSAGQILLNPLGRNLQSVRAVLENFPGFHFCWPGSSSCDFQRYRTLYSKFITFNYLQNDGLLRPKLITEQNGTPGPLTLTACGVTSRTPNLDFLESKVFRIPFYSQIKNQNLKIQKITKWHFLDTESRAPNSHRNRMFQKLFKLSGVSLRICLNSELSPD